LGEKAFTAESAEKIEGRGSFHVPCFSPRVLGVLYDEKILFLKSELRPG
jgi:hypothetical protein